MKQIRFIVCTALLFTVQSCKKNDTLAPGVAAQAKCTIKSETNDLIGNEAFWEYTFNDKGNLSVIKQFNPSGTLQATTTVGEIDLSYRSPGVQTYYAYNANIHSGNPTLLNISSINSSGVSTPDHTTFTFFYDAKKRLIKVSQKTNNITTDNEWDMSIAYNDKDNVTSLSYQFTTGPRTTFVTTVAGYDDKPNPYAAISSWKYLSVHFAWDNYDPQPIISALSRNNPLDYTLGTVPNQWKRAIFYTYNRDGFPISVLNTNTSPAGSTGSFPQTFVYNCR